MTLVGLNVASRLRPRIPATVITGFLGAGKTTLLRHLVQGAHGRRLALVINEFGEVGIDRELLLGCANAACRDDDVIELANGCICCTVADDFLPTIEKLLARENAPDHIVIETSGLALPKPLVKAFAWPEIRSRVTVDGVIAVVDAAAFAAGEFAAPPPGAPHENPLQEVFDDQLACADLVVLNKADLVDDETRARLEAQMGEKLLPGVKIVPTRFGAIDAGVLLGLHAGAEFDVSRRKSAHDATPDHDHDDFESFVVPLPSLADPRPLVQRIGALAVGHEVLRVKGFLDIAGKPMRYAVQGVGGRIDGYYDRPWRSDEARAGAVVVIGKRGLDRAAISAALSG
jgi:cobalamin biosynthesis protein CobW